MRAHDCTSQAEIERTKVPMKPACSDNDEVVVAESSAGVLHPVEEDDLRATQLETVSVVVTSSVRRMWLQWCSS